MTTALTYHGQYGEDAYLRRIFRDQAHGVCVEVGAYDGVTFSATYLFDQLGWQCILVEPAPESCRNIRANRPRATVLEVAASDAAGTATFYLADSAAVLNSLEQDPGQHTTAITVPTDTLDTLLARAGVTRVDFMTIDVEGAEERVLRGLTLARFAPRVVILEDGTLARNAHIVAAMRAQGYVLFHRKGCNEWYTPRTDRALATPINRARVHLHRWLVRCKAAVTALLRRLRRR
jgi:FkbM family methyltransferase